MITDRPAFVDLIQPSNQEMLRLESYAELLSKWNSRINLVAPNTLKTLWERHFLDSAQLFSLTPANAKIWADFGSGGGFPALVIAILAADRRPELRFTLIESDQRKSAFLRTVSRETSLNVEVIAARVEDILPLGADVVSARALAPLTELLGYAERHLARGGVSIFPKGRNHEAELRDALANWEFTYEKVESLSHDEGALLTIGDLRRA